MFRLAWKAAVALVGLSACGGSDAPINGPTETPVAGTTNAPKPGATKLPADVDLSCGLKTPVVSDDVCSEDSECGVASPCHAMACVGVANAKPRTPDTVCTEILQCDSADVNPCGCWEGHCALIPKEALTPKNAPSPKDSVEGEEG